ncbi:MAG: DUF4738 domain-containing protein [Phocaeicola sp.]
MYKTFIFILSLLFALSCTTSKDKEKSGSQIEYEENLDAKAIFQGIWMDENSNQILFQVKGDSVFYVGGEILPLYFKIVGDSLIMQGTVTNKYKIVNQTEYSFSFFSSSGDRISLRKSEMEEEFTTITLSNLPVYREKTQKDLVINYQGKRYRGYSYINPSTKKVIRSEITEEGLDVERIYYDNVIHICVYDGKNRIFGKDITKQLFNDLIEDEFLETAILSDMDFVAVDAEGYHYHALVCEPEEITCYQIRISISFGGEWKYELVK